MSDTPVPPAKPGLLARLLPKPTAEQAAILATIKLPCC